MTDSILFSSMRQKGLRSKIWVVLYGLVLADILFLAMGSSADAQTPADILIIQRQQQKIIRDFQLEERKRKLDRDESRKTPNGLTRKREPGDAAESGGTCIVVKSIVFKGAKVLPLDEIKTATNAYAGQCIGIGGIQEIIRIATNHFIDKGYITTRVVIPPQDLSDGTLEFQVVEGYTEKILPGKSADAINLSTAFPGLEGAILNIRDIEQGLDQINRLASNNARMRLLPGEGVGETNIIVDNDPSRFIYGKVEFDNFGSPSTGENKGNLTLFVDNPLGLNDQIVLGVGSNLEEPTRNALSRNYSVNYSIPWGYWTVNTGFSYFEYKSTLRGQAATFDTDGVGNTTTFGLSRVIQRDQTSKTTLTGTLIRKDNENFIENNLLVTSSRVTSIFDLSAVHTSLVAGATVTFDVGLSRGVPIFGVGGNPSFAENPDDEFNLLHGGLSIAKGWQVGPVVVGVSSNNTAQFSDDRLPGTERLSIGGVQTVRGFKDRSISGNTGFYSRNEIYVVLPRFSGPMAQQILGSIRPYIGVDVGHIFRQKDVGILDDGTMVGGVVGVRAVGGNFTFDFSVGKSLLDKTALTGSPAARDLYLKIGLNY